MDQQPSHDPLADGARKANAPGSWMSCVTSWEAALASAAPLGPVAVGMMGGIVAGEHAGQGLGVGMALMMAASAAAISKSLRARCSCLIMLMAGAGVGTVLHWSRVQCVSPSRVEQMVQAGPVIARVRGQIISEPFIPNPEDSIFRPWQHREDQTLFLLRVEGVETVAGWRSASGVGKVTVGEAVLNIAEGDRVELFGRLVALRPPANPGAVDWRAYYRKQGVGARLYCDQRENVVLMSRERRGFASWIRHKSRGLLTDDIAASAPEESSLLEAMVLGHRSRFDRRLNDIFTRAGCVHFIAASGTNIVILMGALWLAGRLVGLDHRQCAWLMIAAIVLYGVVAEARPPILRACVMGVMFCLAMLFQRAPGHLNWICAAAILLCLIDPLTVFDVGFQLSFAAVLGVAYLSQVILHAGRWAYWWIREVVFQDRYAKADEQLRKTAEKFAPLSAGRKVMRSAAKFGRATTVVFAVSLGAWLFTAPITAASFQQVQPWGVVSSVLVYPLMSLVMVLGIAKAGLAVLSPTLAGLLTSVLSAIDAIMIWLVEKMAALPGATPTLATPPWWIVAGYYLFLLGLMLMIASRKETRSNSDVDQPATTKRRVSFLLPLFVLPLLAGCIAWHFDGQRGEELRVTVLAVGAGSAIVVELPGGETILYDAGSSGVASVGKGVILPYLRQRGIRTIDRIFLSHPDMDHFSGIPDLIAEIPTGPILVNSCFKGLARSRTPASELIDFLKQSNHAPKILEATDSAVALSGFEQLWPHAASCSSLTANDSSTVLTISHAGHSILLTGDISQRAERALQVETRLHADVLLLPHHGSVCPTTREFLKKVGASILVRSSSEPDSETTNGLLELAHGAEMYNTADCGAVTVKVSEAGIRIETWLDCRRGNSSG